MIEYGLKRDLLLEDWVAPIRKIQLEVCQKHGIKLMEMLSRRKGRKVAVPRQEAYWRAYEETSASMPEIGRAFNRDHSSVLYGIRRHEERMNVAR